jgi:hypothetical protein
MSYTYHGTTDLVALPNRTVQTYPSGLVRVERSFVCRKAQVARFRNTIKVNEPMPFDDGAPAIDGLYIFPEPQEIVRDDGFVEFRVTAYGRGRIDFSAQVGAVLGSVRVERSIVTINELENTRVENFASATFNSLNQTLTYRSVFPSSQGLGSLVQPPNSSGASVEIIETSLFNAFTNPRNLEDFKMIQRIDEKDFVLTQLTSTNFGRWAEWIYTYEARRSVFVAYERRIES